MGHLSVSLCPRRGGRGPARHHHRSRRHGEGPGHGDGSGPRRDPKRRWEAPSPGTGVQPGGSRWDRGCSGSPVSDGGLLLSPAGGKGSIPPVPEVLCRGKEQGPVRPGLFCQVPLQSGSAREEDGADRKRREEGAPSGPPPPKCHQLPDRGRRLPGDLQPAPRGSLRHEKGRQDPLYLRWHRLRVQRGHRGTV